MAKAPSTSPQKRAPKPAGPPTTSCTLRARWSAMRMNIRPSLALPGPPRARATAEKKPSTSGASSTMPSMRRTMRSVYSVVEPSGAKARQSRRPLSSSGRNSWGSRV